MSRQDIQRLGERHLLDSLSGAQWVWGNHVMDLGSGAGLPGVPLAVALPQTQFLLCDRSQRRVRFLRQVIQALGLDNAAVWLGDYGQQYPPNAHFDTVVARGVATVEELWAMVQPQLAADGRLLVYERTRVEPVEGAHEESHENKRAKPFKLEQVAVSRHVAAIPGIERTHTLVCVEHAR